MSTDENVMHSTESYNQQRSLSSIAKRSVPDIPSITTIRPSTSHSSERTVNELRVNLSSPSSFLQEKKVSLQYDEKIPQQYITK
jgi:hypothetical protein